MSAVHVVMAPTTASPTSRSTIEGYSLEGATAQRLAPSSSAHDDDLHLFGGGEEGLGEDVTYDAEEHATQQDRGPVLAAGRRVDLRRVLRAPRRARPVPRRQPEHARLPPLPPLGVRERGARPRAAPGRHARCTTCSSASRSPSRSSSRSRIGEPPTLEPVARRLARYPRLRFKLDATPDWTDELIERLVGTGAVDSIDFKGAYKGTPVDVETDPGVLPPHRRGVPGRLARGPRPRRPEARRARSRPYRDRITWDAPIHSVADILALPVPAAHGQPQAVALRLGRGAVRRLRLLRRSAGWAPTAAASSSSASAAGRSSCLAALFHPDAPNDIAPGGYDALDPEPGLPASPLDPDPDPPASAGGRRLEERMPPKPRQVRIESKSALAAMQQLESRSDEELEAETRFKAAAQAILGARAAERMDAKRVARALPRRDRRRAPAGAPAAAADGRGLAGAGRAPRGRPEGGGREARPDAADQPPAADAAAHGRRRAAAGRRASCGASAASCWSSSSIVALLALGFGIVKLVSLPFGGIGAASPGSGASCSSCVVARRAVPLRARRQKRGAGESGRAARAGRDERPPLTAAAPSGPSPAAGSRPRAAGRPGSPSTPCGSGSPPAG